MYPLISGSEFRMYLRVSVSVCVCVCVCVCDSQHDTRKPLTSEYTIDENLKCYIKLSNSQFFQI